MINFTFFEISTAFLKVRGDTFLLSNAQFSRLRLQYSTRLFKDISGYFQIGGNFLNFSRPFFLFGLLFKIKASFTQKSKSLFNQPLHFFRDRADTFLSKSRFLLQPRSIFQNHYDVFRSRFEGQLALFNDLGVTFYFFRELRQHFQNLKPHFQKNQEKLKHTHTP